MLSDVATTKGTTAVTTARIRKRNREFDVAEVGMVRYRDRLIVTRVSRSRKDRRASQRETSGALRHPGGNSPASMPESAVLLFRPSLTTATPCSSTFLDWQFLVPRLRRRARTWAMIGRGQTHSVASLPSNTGQE